MCKFSAMPNWMHKIHPPGDQSQKNNCRECTRGGWTSYEPCEVCGGRYINGIWYSKEGQEARERKIEAFEHVTQVDFKDKFAKPIKKLKKRSPSAVKQAKRKAAMTEDEKKSAKEKDKIRNQEKRREESKYETTEDHKIGGAARTALCRHKKDEEGKKKANEQAKLGMQEYRKRKKDKTEDEDGDRYYEDTSRTKRMHPIARKNVSREFRYIKETETWEELINYFNVEKQEWLYMNPNGVHYRKLHYDRVHVYDDDDYEIVDLDVKDYMDLLVINNSRK